MTSSWDRNVSSLLEVIHLCSNNSLSFYLFKLFMENCLIKVHELFLQAVVWFSYLQLWGLHESFGDKLSNHCKRCFNPLVLNVPGTKNVPSVLRSHRVPFRVTGSQEPSQPLVGEGEVPPEQVTSLLWGHTLDSFLGAILETPMMFVLFCFILFYFLLTFRQHAHKL